MKRNVILMKISSLAVQEVVKITTSGAASGDVFVTITFPFQLGYSCQKSVVFDLPSFIRSQLDGALHLTVKPREKGPCALLRPWKMEIKLGSGHETGKIKIKTG